MKSTLEKKNRLQFIIELVVSEIT